MNDHKHQLVCITTEWSVKEYTEPLTVYYWGGHRIKAFPFSYLCCAAYCNNMFCFSGLRKNSSIFLACFSYTVSKVIWDYFEWEVNQSHIRHLGSVKGRVGVQTFTQWYLKLVASSLEVRRLKYKFLNISPFLWADSQLQKIKSNYPLEFNPLVNDALRSLGTIWKWFYKFWWLLVGSY